MSEEERSDYEQALERYNMHLVQYRNQLLDQIYASSRDIDNIILIVSTGALVLSIGLLHNFTSLFALWLVRVSWISLLTTLIILLLSHYFSIKSFEKQVDLLDEDNLKGRNIWMPFVTFSNIISKVFLVVGISCLAWYAFDNLKLTPDLEEKCSSFVKETQMSCQGSKGGSKTPPSKSERKQGGVKPKGPSPKPVQPAPSKKK